MMRIRFWSIALLLLRFIPSGLDASEADWGPWRSMLEHSQFQENDETRLAFASVLKAPAYPSIEAEFDTFKQVSDGKIVRFEARRAAEYWYLIFRNQRGEIPYDSYPLWGRGTWIVKKNLFTGQYDQAKIFLQDDENTFVRIFPMLGNRSRMDLYLYGKRISSEVLLGASFVELLTSPFARILYLSSSVVDWSLIFPDLRLYGHQQSKSLVREVSKFHEQIVEVDDAALDGWGRNVLIEDGTSLAKEILEAGYTGFNCSGYVKWIADGLYSAWAGQPGTLYLDLESLKAATVEEEQNPSWNNTLSAKEVSLRKELRGKGLLRDPWFGLDWSRNLVRAVEETRLGRSLLQAEMSELEVTDIPWLHYRKNRGYPLEELNALLYILAAQRPGTVWFASISSRFVLQDTSNPLPIHQHWHVLALVPWFETSGLFRVAALDTGQDREVLSLPGTQTVPDLTAKLTQLAVQYASLGTSSEPIKPEIYVHLSRADIPKNFVSVPLPLMSKP